jgi:5-methylcytosine-specific restriction enzyme A
MTPSSDPATAARSAGRRSASGAVASRDEDPHPALPRLRYRREGPPRCTDCQRSQDQAKGAKRPGLKTYGETQRRARAVAEYRATIGDWCPGVPELRRPAHPAANLWADHVWEVRLGGPESGPLVVRCVGCNAARSAVALRSLTTMLGQDPSPAERPITPFDDYPGPVVA